MNIHVFRYRYHTQIRWLGGFFLLGVLLVASGLLLQDPPTRNFGFIVLIVVLMNVGGELHQHRWELRHKDDLAKNH
jgi:hypothetical protein